MEVVGKDHSYALLQISANPPPIQAFAGLGAHAIAFAGETELSRDIHASVRQLKEALDDADDSFTWDLDIEVGPRWRGVKTVAPFVAVTNVNSRGADEDDNFEFGVKFRNPAWTPKLASPQRIILHVTIEQAGEKLDIQRLSYSATATGSLLNPAEFVPVEEG